MKKGIIIGNYNKYRGSCKNPLAPHPCPLPPGERIDKRIDK